MSRRLTLPDNITKAVESLRDLSYFYRDEAVKECKNASHGSVDTVAMLVRMSQKAEREANWLERRFDGYSDSEAEG